MEYFWHLSHLRVADGGWGWKRNLGGKGQWWEIESNFNCSVSTTQE